MANSINTNIAAFFAQANITSAAALAQSSVARLSSGNRIVQASDDVAALASGTSLQSQVSALKTALTNASQGTSLLQVADGALAQIGSILQQQQSLALQAGSGSLTNTDRGFLNQQFQALSEEINILAASTTFNGVNLVDGSLSNVTTVTTDTATGNNTSIGTGILDTITNDFDAGDKLTINGYTVTFATTPTAGRVTIGNTAENTVKNLAAFLNASGAPELANLTFAQDATDLDQLNAFYSGGALGGNLSITTKTTLVSGSTAALTLLGTSGVTTITAAGTSGGLGVDRTFAVGSVTGAVLSSGGATKYNAGAGIDVSNVRNNADFVGTFGSANVGTITAGTYAPVTDAATTGTFTTANASNTVVYTFATAGAAAAFAVGSTFSLSGATGTIKNINLANIAANQIVTAVDTANNTITFSATDASGAAINANGVATTAASTGTLAQDDQANFTLTVGDITYTSSRVGISSSVGTASYAAPRTVTFTGTDALGNAAGGSFDINIQTNGAILTNSITSQNSLAAAAAQLNAALGGISFQQNRDVSSFTNPGSNVLLDSTGAQIANLTGADFNLNTDDFGSTATNITKFTVTAPTAGSSNTDAVFSATVGGQVYTSLAGIGNQIGVNKQIVLQSATDPTRTLTLTTGSAGISSAPTTALDLSTSANALAVQNAIKDAFGISDGLTFQLGSTSVSTVGVNIGGATTTSLFAGATLDISTQDGASAAATVVGTAIANVTSIRANVGALQSQFAFASAALQSSVQNQDAARGQFLDTDIATESTLYATAQVKLQAGISVLAQANQSLQALLKLIQ